MALQTSYIAPEVLAKADHSVSSEVWSIGCMVYAMLCGTPPFETESVTSTYQLISNCDYKIPSHLSITAKQFIQNMLTQDPSARGSLGEPPPTSSGHNLQSHPFLVDQFIPPSLPCSALTTTPVFTPSQSAQGRNCQGKIQPPSPLTIPTVGRSEESTGCGSFSPLFSPSKSLGSSLKKMGLFSSKDKFLEQAIAGLTTCLGLKDNNSEVSNIGIAPMFISKWVDYSNKFGFGFQLSDGSVGVLFNDSTKIGTMLASDNVEFTDMKGKIFKFPWDEKNDNQPFPELKDRVSLLKYYIQYMEEHLADSITFHPGMDTVKKGLMAAVPQLRRWNRRGNCVAMELNIQLVQVNHMSDHVKVVIWVYDGDLLGTFITTTSTQTFFLSSACPSSLRCRLEDTLLELKELALVKSE